MAFRRTCRNTASLLSCTDGLPNRQSRSSSRLDLPILVSEALKPWRKTTSSHDLSQVEPKVFVYVLKKLEQDVRRTGFR